MELPEPDKNESIESAPKKTNIFQASSSGVLFAKPTTGGLFTNKDPKPTTSLFGSNSSKPSSGLFATAKSETKNSEGSGTSFLMKSGEGSNKDANPALTETKSSGSGVFGKTGDTKSPLFGNNSISKPGLFSSNDNKDKSSVLFGGLSKTAEAKVQPIGDEKKESAASGGISTAKSTGFPGGNLFSSSTSKPQDSTKSSGAIFGDKKPENSSFQ